MHEAAALVSFFFAFALVHGASPARVPFERWRTDRTWMIRTLALVAASLGVSLWTKADDLTGALLVAVAALCAFATIFVLLAPLFPRALFGLAILAPPTIVALALAGGGR